MAGFWVCIPARRASSRLPNKPLADLGGRPMVLRVADLASQSGADRVVVATDDREIQSVVTSAGFEARLTAAHHPTGTDRLAELAQQLEADPGQLLVNLQGDEPFLPSDLLGRVAQALAADPGASVATAVTPITDPTELTSPHVVKAVLSRQGRALYFSRAAIPHCRETIPPDFLAYRHLGLYAYRAGPLADFGRWPQPLSERSEHLEQLRWLDQGHAIAALILQEPLPAGIDTPEDLQKAQAAFHLYCQLDD